MNGLRAGIIVLLVAAIATVVVSTAASEDDLGTLGNKRSVVAGQVAAKGKKGILSAAECTATGGTNTKLDCDDPFPNNEPHIAVDPANPQHMIASSNDYGSCCDQYYTTFDGGATWLTGNMSTEKQKDDLGPIGSDPVTSFDVRHRTALHSSLNFFLSKDGEETCDGDVVVSPSRDGGVTWPAPAVVYEGHGCDLSGTQVFNDKEWITTDNNPGSRFYGRSYLTWTKFIAHHGEDASAAIWESHSDDGGKKWSEPKEISGSNKALCSFQTTGKDGPCDEDQISAPTIGPDGTVYVAFENGQNESLFESPAEFDSQYLLVTSTDGGGKWSGPTFVVGLEDGADDLPRNADDRQTLTGYQVRVWSPGNIVASPTDGKLYVTFADNRNGTHDSPDPLTNLDVFVVSSSDRGAHWTGPVLVDGTHGDQWFPWVDVNPRNGKIGIVYNDRGDANGTFYNASLAQGSPGSMVKTTLSTAPSNPVESAFFQAEDPACPECSVFFGDYIGLAYDSDGHANATWTDMRDPAADGGFSEFIYYTRT
jgi:hypothetical protein